MLILTAIQSIFAMSFILIGLVALFGIGLTGLLFLVPGAIFAAIAGMTQEKSRAAAVAALAANGVLATMAVRTLEKLFASETAGISLHQTVGVPSLVDYLVPSAVLVLVAIGVLGVIMDWRTLRKAKWF
jgi:hypothetical protein